MYPSPGTHTKLVKFQGRTVRLLPGMGHTVHHPVLR